MPDDGLTELPAKERSTRGPESITSLASSQYGRAANVVIYGMAIRFGVRRLRPKMIRAESWSLANALDRSSSALGGGGSGSEMGVRGWYAIQSRRPVGLADPGDADYDDAALVFQGVTVGDERAVGGFVLRHNPPRGRTDADTVHSLQLRDRACRSLGCE
jgi:hypothetical protein